MAACTHGVTFTSTTNAATYTSGAFTPAAGDLLVGLIRAGATKVVPPNATLSTSLGVTFSYIARRTFRTSSDSLYLFVADTFAVASSQTATFTCTTDNANGINLFICRVSGMSRTSGDAVRQSSGQDNQAAGTTPAPVFTAAALTGNVCLGLIGNASNPAALTFPTSWTEQVDTGYATPTSGAEYVTRDSGFTGTTVTWGSTSATAFGSLIVELDTTVMNFMGAQLDYN